MQSQQDIDQLAAAIYRDKVLRARAADPCEKLVDGIRLFEFALGMTKAGAADMLGSNDEAEVMQEVQRRFSLVRMREERGLYQPVPSLP
jgi:hypothetical protein